MIVNKDWKHKPMMMGKCKHVVNALISFLQMNLSNVFVDNTYAKKNVQEKTTKKDNKSVKSVKAHYIGIKKTVLHTKKLDICKNDTIRLYSDLVKLCRHKNLDDEFSHKLHKVRFQYIEVYQFFCKLYTYLKF